MHVWGISGRHIAGNLPSPRAIQELENVVLEKWRENLCSALIVSLIPCHKGVYVTFASGNISSTKDDFLLSSIE